MINLSGLYAGDKGTLDFVLSYEAVGRELQGLDPVPNPLAYKEAAKATIKLLITHYFRHFRNYLVTKPQLNDTQQTIVNELGAALTAWDNTRSALTAPAEPLKPTRNKPGRPPEDLPTHPKFSKQAILL